MNQRIYDRIRTILETTPGLTQKGLAERMGLNPAAVNRMLYGRRNIIAEEIPLIESYIGVRLNLSAPEEPLDFKYGQDAADTQPGFSDVAASHLKQLRRGAGDAATPTMVPVYGHTSVPTAQGLKLSESNLIDWVTRHPSQMGVTSAFAIYAFSEDMEPRYFRGEIVYIHPGRPPHPNGDCLIEMKDGTALLRRFVSQGAQNIRVAQFKPAREHDIAMADVKAVYTVIGRG